MKQVLTLRFKTEGQKRKDFFVHLLDSTANGRTSMQLQLLIEVTGLLEIQSVKHHLQLSQLLALQTPLNLRLKSLLSQWDLLWMMGYQFEEFVLPQYHMTYVPTLIIPACKSRSCMYFFEKKKNEPTKYTTQTTERLREYWKWKSSSVLSTIVIYNYEDKRAYSQSSTRRKEEGSAGIKIHSSTQQLPWQEVKPGISIQLLQPGNMKKNVSVRITSRTRNSSNLVRRKTNIRGNLQNA